MIDWVAKHSGVTSISATVPDDNYPSQSFAARLGLSRTNETRRDLPLCIHSSAASSLAILTEENLARTRTDGAKRWRCSPIPQSFPAPFLEPRKAFRNVGDVQNRIDAVHEHSLERIALSP